MKKTIKILFICHGNICRSASAQYVMQKLVNEAGLTERFHIDSAATSAEELGNPVYPPMERVLRAHGVPCGGHRARRMTKGDYDNFDMLIGMDRENLYFMNRMYGAGAKDKSRDNFWSSRYDDVTPDDPDGKISLLMDYTDRPGEVADPWYTRDFEATYRDVLDGCRGLLEHCVTEQADGKI